MWYVSDTLLVVGVVSGRYLIIREEFTTTDATDRQAATAGPPDQAQPDSPESPLDSPDTPNPET